MIDIVTWETAHLYGDAWIQHHKLRYDIFVKRQGWEIPVHNGIEYDQFDTPAATYLLSRGRTGAVNGITRLVPTTAPYMIDQVWPQWVKGDRPHDPRVWEGTRFGVSPELTAEERARVSGELVLACQEFGQIHGIESIWVLMPMLIIRRAIGQLGCPYEWMSDPQRIGMHKIAIARVEVSPHALARARDNLGIHHSVLNPLPEHRVAA